jgi:hypothetical protein
MNRLTTNIALAALAIGAFALTGCAAETAGHPTDGVWGYVVSARNAALEAEAEQNLAGGELVVDRVLTPGDAWIVVHLDDDGSPGMRVGLAPISSGESRNVRVPVEGDLTDSLIVAVHADRGTRGVFDFAMDDPAGSPDRPYFVDGAELATVVSVK